MSLNGRTKWIALVIGIITMLTAGGTVVLRVLNVESKEESTAARDALKVEIRGEIKAVEARHQRHEESLHKIETDVTEVRTDVTWIKDALWDGGYRSPKVKSKVKP